MLNGVIDLSKCNMWSNPSPGATSEGCISSVDVVERKSEQTRNGSMLKSSKRSEAEVQLQDQSSRMPLKKILVVYLGIGETTCCLYWAN